MKILFVAALLVGFWGARVIFGSLSLVFENEVYSESASPVVGYVFKYLIIPIVGIGILYYMYGLFASFFERVYLQGGALEVKRLFKTIRIPIREINSITIEKTGDFMGTNETRMPGYVLSRLLGINNKIVIQYGRSGKNVVITDVALENAKQIENALKKSKL